MNVELDPDANGHTRGGLRWAMALHVALPVPLDPFATAWVGAGFAPLSGGWLPVNTPAFEFANVGLTAGKGGYWALRAWTETETDGMALDVAICDERMGEWGNAVLPRMWQRARYL